MRIRTHGAVEPIRLATAAVLGVSLVVLVPSEAPAQVAGVIKNLFDQVTINAVTPNPAPPANNPNATIDHRSHFFLGGENLDLAVRQLNVAIASQLASFPLASSSGGFTFGTNQRGEIVTTSTTFGPLFAERAVTIGHKQLNLGVTLQGTSYDSFDGQSLGAFGGLRFISEHNNCCGATPDPPSGTDFNPAFERDLLLSTLRADITTNTTAFFANYGVTDRFDVGLALPISHVSIDARVDGEILRLGSGDTSPTHAFDAARSKFTSKFGSDSATGLGDILLRAKYNVYRTTTAAFAGALDLRLPTGDKDNLLGTGATQAQLFFIASGDYGRLSPHVNFGYTFSSGEASALAASEDDTIKTVDGVPIPDPGPSVDLSVPDELNYTFGVSMAATSRITVGFDVRGRSIQDVPRFDVDDITYNNRAPGTFPPSLPPYVSTNEFALKPKTNANQVLGVIGAKFNLAGKLLLNSSLLFAMTDAGLKPKPTLVIGLDYVH